MLLRVLGFEVNFEPVQYGGDAAVFGELGQGDGDVGLLDGVGGFRFVRNSRESGGEYYHGDVSDLRELWYLANGLSRALAVSGGWAATLFSGPVNGSRRRAPDWNR